MNRQEFKNIEIGDMVIITRQGQNRGKMGIVREIERDGEWDGGRVYLEPFQCEFGFYKGRCVVEKNGFYRFPHEVIGYLKKPTNKIFYIAKMFGEDAIKWPTDNFTEKELQVIDRFLEEFNEHASGLSIDCVDILDNDEDEDERDQSLVFKFEGSREDIEKIMEEMKRVAKEIAPEARLEMETIDIEE